MESATLEAILVDVAAGEPVRRVLRTHNVNPRVFYSLTDADEDVAKRYARAKSAGLDSLADEAMQIADDCEADADAVAKARVQVDVRKWLLSKLAPKKYGERLDVNANVTGGLALNVNTKPKDVGE